MTAVQQYLQRIGNLQTLALMATEAEYGSSLREVGVTPYMIGVGPIQAAMHTTKILVQLANEGSRPDLLLSIGSAGSATLEHGHVYQVSEVAYRDMDASPFGFEIGQTPFDPYPAIVHIAAEIPNVPKASLSTGAAIIDQQGTTGKTFTDIREDMVDMETAAVLTVANHFGLPMIGLRGISDGKEDSKGIETWEEYLTHIDQKLAQLYLNLEEGLQSGSISAQQLTAMPPAYLKITSKMPNNNMRS